MYGDPEVMRRRAGALREQAVDVRALADRLVAQTESLGWRGRAADSMRERVQERATRLRAVASDHDTAADSLERHGHEVARLQETIAEIERRAESLVAEARTRVSRLESQHTDPAAVRVEPDPDDRLLIGFTPPPRGHKDWLTVELPGLRPIDDPPL